ncbi:MAG: hypothetical protein IPF99_17895 [Deltaproteobacteria bacterium]|nr:hypothetical protein [Deltaproteobacteria bacterium]
MHPNIGLVVGRSTSSSSSTNAKGTFFGVLPAFTPSASSAIAAGSLCFTMATEEVTPSRAPTQRDAQARCAPAALTLGARDPLETP